MDAHREGLGAAPEASDAIEKGHTVTDEEVQLGLDAIDAESCGPEDAGDELHSETERAGRRVA